VPSDVNTSVSTSVGDKHASLLEGEYQAEKAMRIRMERELQLSRDREVALEARIRELEGNIAGASTQLPGRLERPENDREVQEWKRTWGCPFRCCPVDILVGLAHNYRVQLNDAQQYITRVYMQLRHWESQYATVPSAQAQQGRMWEDWVKIRDDIFAQVLTFPPEPLRGRQKEDIWLELGSG